MFRYLSGIMLLVLIFMSPLVYSDTLKVGVATNYPPVIFKHDGKIVGIEADLAQAVGKETGMDIKFEEMPWESLEKALNDGKIDVVMSGVSITQARQQRVDFTKPYMVIGQMVMIKADNIMTHSSKLSMYKAGRRFGVENNTTGQQYVNDTFHSAEIKSYPTIEEGVAALKAGEIDYFVHDAPTVWKYTVLPRTQDRELFGLYEYMTEEPLAWAVKKGNTQLRDKLNKALDKMQQQGLVQRITNKWLPLRIEVGK